MPIFLVFSLFRMAGDNAIMLDRVQESFRASGRQRENRGLMGLSVVRENYGMNGKLLVHGWGYVTKDR
jgi:hypothetical protein